MPLVRYWAIFFCAEKLCLMGLNPYRLYGSDLSGVASKWSRFPPGLSKTAFANSAEASFIGRKVCHLAFVVRLSILKLAENYYEIYTV